MEKQIILLNGPSGSGKSTLAKALQALIEERRKERYEIVSIDDFLKMTPDEPIYEDDVFEISANLCEKMLDGLKTAPGAIIDHVITGERIFRQLETMLSPYRLYPVHVTCPPAILKERERQRKNRCPGSAEASYEYLYPKEGYALTVDTHRLTAEECSQQILEALQSENPESEKA